MAEATGSRAEHGKAGGPEVELREALVAEAMARDAAVQADRAWQAAALRVVAARAEAREAVLAALIRRAERERQAAAREAETMALATVAALEGADDRLRQAFRNVPSGRGTKRLVRVWDPLVRAFHWSLVAAFLANAFLTEPGKALHLWLGYGVAALVVLRVIWGFVGTRHARFADFVPTPAAVWRQIVDMVHWRGRPHAGHSPLGALMIFNLLATMAGLAVSGHAMTTVAYFGVAWVADLHEALVTWAQISVLLHVAAVLVESRRLGVNLPRSMVTGNKDLP